MMSVEEGCMDECAHLLLAAPPVLLGPVAFIQLVLFGCSQLR
jgi:hypothetical protein